MRTFLLGVLMAAAWPAERAPAAQCEPTPERFLGTHYKEIERHQIDVGQGLIILGRVLSASDCKPVRHARIEHWQTNRDGFYVDRLRAYLYSDGAGGYRFETEWPGAAVPHIHFRVVAPGFRTLVTQWIGEQPVDEIRFDLVLEPEAQSP